MILKPRNNNLKHFYHFALIYSVHLTQFLPHTHPLLCSSFPHQKPLSFHLDFWQTDLYISV